MTLIESYPSNKQNQLKNQKSVVYQKNTPLHLKRARFKKNHTLGEVNINSKSYRGHVLLPKD